MIDDVTCRICFESTSISNLIAPCLCESWVHQICLKEWRYTNVRVLEKCEVCQYTYRLKESNEDNDNQEFLQSLKFMVTFAFRCVIGQESTNVIIALTFCVLSVLLLIHILFDIWLSIWFCFFIVFYFFGIFFVLKHKLLPRQWTFAVTMNWVILILCIPGAGLIVIIRALYESFTCPDMRDMLVVEDIRDRIDSFV